MIQLIIADDEDIIREGLRESIEWDKLGVTFAGEARDGMEALNLARRIEADIYLVDIMMPLMKGLDFVEKLKQLQPEALVIIITGYDDFSFAQRSIKLRIFDYILKPIDENELNAILRKAVGSINEKKQMEHKLNSMQKNMEEMHPYALTHYIRDCLNGKIEARRQESFRDSFEKHLKKYLSVLCVPKIDMSFAGDEKNRLDRAELPGKFKQTATEVSIRDAELLFTEVMDTGVYMVVQSDREDASAQFLQKYKEKIGIEFCYEAGIYLVQISSGPEYLNDALQTINRRIRENEKYSVFMRRIKQYIDANYMNSELSLNMLAQEFNTSEGYISRKFKQEMNLTYSSYIEKKRIEVAAEMLLAEDNRVYEIAEKIGYTSQHYFATVFRKTMGCPPTDYKKKVQSGEM